MLNPLETEMLALIKSLEWSGTGDAREGGQVACCPSCEAERREGVHMEHCQLRAIIAKAEAVQNAGAVPDAWSKVLPDGWEIRPRAYILDADGKTPGWARWEWYVLDGRTDIRGEGNTIRAAIEDAGISLDSITQAIGTGEED